MHWNYRIVREEEFDGEYNIITDSVCEVYYSDDGEPTGYAKAELYWDAEIDDPEELLRQVTLAFHKPILDLDIFNTDVGE